jgi:copper(I)-binding protein
MVDRSTILIRHSLYGECSALAFAILMGLGSTDAEAIFIASEPWVRPAARGHSTEAYMLLTSTEGATLVGVHCAAAASIEIRPAGASRSPVRELALPAGEKVMLAPKANRIVLRSLHRSLKLGDRVAIVLIVKAVDGGRQEIPLDAEVRLNSPTDDHLRPHRH